MLARASQTLPKERSALGLPPCKFSRHRQPGTHFGRSKWQGKTAPPSPCPIRPSYDNLYEQKVQQNQGADALSANTRKLPGATAQLAPLLAPLAVQSKT